jgi:pentatricopeptide repeat protein
MKMKLMNCIARRYISSASSSTRPAASATYSQRATHFSGHAFSNVSSLNAAPNDKSTASASGSKSKFPTLEDQIRELTASKRVEDAERILLSALKRGNRPVTRVYNHVIHALARLGRVDKCREWLTTMKSRPDVYTYSAIFNAYVRAAKRHATSGGPQTGCRAHSEGAIEIWHRMMRENIKPHTICTNTFLAVLIENGDMELANEYLTKFMDSKLLQPNVFTFAPFLNLCAKKGDAAAASMWLERMKEYEVNPDAHLYQNAMEAYAKNSDASSAHKIFDNMIAARVDQDAHCHGSLIRAYSSRGDHAGAAAAFENMESANVTPNLIAFTAVMNAFAKNGKSDEVVQYFDKMSSVGVKADGVSYNCVIDAFSKKGDVDGVLLWMQKRSDAGFALDVTTFNSVLDVYSKLGNLEEVERWFERARQAGCADLANHNVLLHLHAKLGDSAAVTRCLNQMRRDRIRPDNVSFGGVLDGFARRGDVDATYHWLERMETDFGVVPNTISKNCVLHALAKKKDYESAIDFLQNMDRPDLWSFNAVLSACAESDQPDLTNEIFESMSGVQIYPNIHSYNSLLYAHAQAGDHETCSAILEKMKLVGIEPNDVSMRSAFGAFDGAKSNMSSRGVFL